MYCEGAHLDEPDDANDAPWKANVAGFVDRDAYLCKVRAAGGFPAYEKAHRMRLTATCARVVSPRLPVDAVSHVVAFAFHTGYY